MNGLPQDIDLSFFGQRRLEQVCLGEHQAQLRFDAGISIDLEAEFTLNGQRAELDDAYLMRQLIGLSVQSVSREGAGDIRLQFGGHVLILHDSNTEYESYTIQTAAGPIVV